MTASDTSAAPATQRAGAEQTVRLTAAQALVRFLQQQFTERDGEAQRAIPAIFGIFGHGNVAGMGQAITQEGTELPLYQPKNEQAMVHTALGFAKASRRMQTLACTASIGPGSTNMLTGAGTASANRLPVLLLPSDTFANRFQGPVLQQLEHPSEADLTVNDAFRPLSRFFDRISRPEQLLTALPEAMRVLFDPAETGAVTISLHQDVQGEAFDFPLRFFAPRIWSVTRRPPAQAELERAVELLRGAQRPLLIAGGGVRYSAAEQELRRFAESFEVPVAETSAGKGSLSYCEWLLGGIGVNGTRPANEIAAQADVVICLGTRLSDFTTGSHSLFQNPNVSFVGINVNEADAYKLSSTPLVADAREALTALAEQLRRSEPRGGGAYREKVPARVRSWRQDLLQDIAPRQGERIGQGEVLHTLNESVRPGDWVIAAAGWQPGDLLKLWETPPGSFTHIEFGFSCMGHEIPAGLGVRMHVGPQPEVFVVIGDGTYLMNPTELFTSAQEGLKLTVLVLDNGGYQSISRLALGKAGSTAGNEFRGRQEGARLPVGERVGVDFLANAKSLGCESVLAQDGQQLSTALAQARAGSQSTVIVCPTEFGRSLLDSGAFWDIGVAEVSTDPATQEVAAAHLEAAKVQRRY
ncbi:MAG: 3D-(3,5/4)-trihydroxycyclohexane-1,2-dione acylhydrolase (decyclizing) [Solirubrobacteraceae bacterium]